MGRPRVHGVTALASAARGERVRVDADGGAPVAEVAADGDATDTPSDAGDAEDGVTAGDDPA